MSIKCKELTNQTRLTIHIFIRGVRLKFFASKQTEMVTGKKRRGKNGEVKTIKIS